MNNKKYLLKAFFMVLITSFLFFYEFGLTNIYNSLGPYVVKDFNLSPTAFGFVASLFFYTDLTFLIPAGVLVDRYSPRWIITFVLLISSTGVLLNAHAHSLAPLIIARLLMGFGGGFCLVSCIRIAVNWFPAQYLASISGFIITMGMLGGLMVQTPLTLLILHTSWRYALEVVAIIGYVVAVLIFLCVRDMPLERREELTGHIRKHHESGVLKCLKLALLKKQNWYCGLYTCLMNLPIFMLGALLGIPYLTQVNQLTTTQAATVSGMLYLGTMIGSPLMGSLSDALKNRKLPMLVNAILAIALVFIIIQVTSNSFWLLLMLFLLLGIITSAQIISYPTVVESNSKMISSSSTCVISMMCMVSGAFIQPLSGFLLSLKGGSYMSHGTMDYPVASYHFVMNILPIAFILAFIFALLIRETHGRSLID
jgi:MFS family permease